MTATQDALAPLLTPAGWALLATLPPYRQDEALALGERLRAQGHSPDLVAAALTQQRLRARAAAKFGPFASTMLFTSDGLEQATRLAVAAHHAARYQHAGTTRVADLGCGIGGDALALAGLGLGVLAVERDETTAALATVNLMRFPEVTVRCADAREVDLVAEGVDGVFADPARRSGGRRLTDPEQWSPPLSTVLAWREQVPALGVKAAPGIDHALLPADAHVQWVSVDGGVLEADIWCGPLALEGPGRSALVLRSAPDATGGAGDAGAGPDSGTGAGSAAAGTTTSPDAVARPAVARLSDPECTDPTAPPLQLPPIAGQEELGEYVLEPDGAAIRAGLVAHLASRAGATPLAPRIAYLTGPRLPGADLAPFLRAWRVREVLPLHLKALRARVREQGIGRLEIHRRGVDVSPDALRASLHLEGQAGETWLLTRMGPGGPTLRDRGPRGAVLVVDPVPMTS
ncbi:THUMP-like domain-containing protein [uncultured Actinomyces sp.]|uniref:class I SAM-dependent methyltransferase n=1 Tax=uncultured Actinomyces sp. TaxID=249061 RepID=UPI002622B8AF|nr:SAM-dependent methyltransferase [uncultured Actinomyces sp.]